MSDVARQLDLGELEGAADIAGTPFATPSQQFSPASSCATLSTAGPIRFVAGGGQAAGQSQGHCDESDLDSDSMASLQLALVGASSSRWDGAQGSSYRRKRPVMVEALAAACRTRGGYMPAADQWGVLTNLVEPMSGATAWLSGMHGVMAAEIVAANSGTFPSAALSDDFTKAALGHLATNADYLDALRNTLQDALPGVAISMASDYIPSRASGVLVPAPRAAALSPEDEQFASQLRTELKRLQQEYKEISAEQERLQQRRDRAAAECSRIGPLLGPAVANAQTAAATPEQKQTATQMQQQFSAAKQTLDTAKQDLQAISQRCSSNVSSSIAVRQQLQGMTSSSAAASSSAERVKAMLHPALGKLCTAHDCVMLKLFAALDVVYGIASPLQQVKFFELAQGKGVGVPADESVREFAARVKLHGSTLLNGDPGREYSQFFAGLADKQTGEEGKRAIQCDEKGQLTIDEAVKQVELIEFRQLEDLRMRAATGDPQAAAELRRRAAALGKKATKTTPAAAELPKGSKDTKAPATSRAYHPDPDHPQARCKLHRKHWHTNAECFTQQSKGGANVAAMPAMASGYGEMAPVAAAAAAPGFVNATAAMDALACMLAERLQLAGQPWQDPIAAAAAAGPSRAAVPFRSGLPGGIPGATRPRPPNPPSPHGQPCTICGYRPGHGTGFCYFEHPDKAPGWRPSTAVAPGLIAHWQQRRRALGLPHLEPKAAAVANVGLAAPYDPYGSSSSTGGYICLPAIAQWESVRELHYLDDTVQIRTTIDPQTGQVQQMVAAMPRSFVQYPQGQPSNSRRVVQQATGQLPITAGVPGEPGVNGAADIAAPEPNAASNTIGAKRSSAAREQQDAAAADIAADAAAAAEQQPEAKRVRWRRGLELHPNALGSQQRGSAVQAQAPSAEEITSAVVDLQQASNVLCLDTFINRNAATGVSLCLPDGRWQLPMLFASDTGATFGVIMDAYRRDIQLPYKPSVMTLVLADGKRGDVLGITAPVELVFAKGTPHQRSIRYQFLVLPGRCRFYNLLLAKNAMKEVGGYVDPAESAFYYRTGPGQGAPKHALPVRCAVPADLATATDCANTLQHILAVARAYTNYTVAAAGGCCRQ